MVKKISFFVVSSVLIALLLASALQFGFVNGLQFMMGIAFSFLFGAQIEKIGKRIRRK